MNNFLCFGKHLQHFCCYSCLKLSCFCRSAYFILSRVDAFPIHVCYFLSLSFLGFWALKALKARTEGFTPRSLDMFFTSVSAATVSSMSTVEIEVFSNTQLIVLIVLMLIGGEVFTSMVALHLWRYKYGNRVESASSHPTGPGNSVDEIELGLAPIPAHNETSKSNLEFLNQIKIKDYDLKYTSIKFLGYVVLGYLLVIHVIGVVLVLVYFTIVSSAEHVLENKGLNLFTFSIFTVVSTFANCGFFPTNENMIVFSKNSGLLLILIPQLLVGNTLFPPLLRSTIWVLGNFIKKKECNYLLNEPREVAYQHLLPSLHSSRLVVTVLGFIVIQFILFCSMEWGSEALSGLSSYQKVVGALFQTVNSRHAGETIVDLSALVPAVLVLFIVMMYLPPYTSFLPRKDGGKQCPQDTEHEVTKKRGGKVVDNLIFSQLSYLAIFVILVCITERKKMREDALNFNVLNIVVEVTSAYGNVGFTSGYSCDRLLKADDECKNKWFGFSGKWSDQGKIVLIVVMFFGRLKKFNMNGGKAWKLLL